MVRRRLSDQIEEDYLRRIGSGQLEAGTALPPQSALCDSYGVGASVVREALRGLAAKGFLVIRQGSATTVAPRSLWQVLDPAFLAVNTSEELFENLQQSRELLEPRLASLAALHADASTIDELDELTRRLADTGAVAKEHATIDSQFHETIAIASGNPVLASMHSSVTNLGELTRVRSAEIPGAVDRAVVWHRHIADAIRMHNPDAAEAAMRAHLGQVRSEMESLGLIDALGRTKSGREDVNAI